MRRKDIVPTAAGRQYLAAHAAHYQSKDLHAALELYQRILAQYPDTQEAGYSRSQIDNIVHAVVPKQTLLETELHLALTRLDPGKRPSGPTSR